MMMQAVAELGYEAILLANGDFKVLKNGEPYSLTKAEQAKAEKRAKEMAYQAASKVIKDAIQNHIDDLARAHRYDSMASVRGYTGFPSDFQRECMDMAIWAGDCWKKAGELEEEVKAGTRAMPTTQEVLDALPKYEG